jgi:hypothetical protein
MLVMISMESSFPSICLFLLKKYCIILQKTKMEDALLIKKRKSQVVLIFATVFFALAIAPGIWLAIMSVLLFEYGKSLIIILLFSFIVSFPFVCFFSFISWVFYGYKKYGIAVFISLLPVLNIIFTGILFLLVEIFY